MSYSIAIAVPIRALAFIIARAMILICMNISYINYESWVYRNHRIPYPSDWTINRWRRSCNIGMNKSRIIMPNFDEKREEKFSDYNKKISTKRD